MKSALVCEVVRPAVVICKPVCPASLKIVAAKPFAWSAGKTPASSPSKALSCVSSGVICVPSAAWQGAFMQHDQPISAANTNTWRRYSVGAFILVLFSSEFKHRKTARVAVVVLSESPCPGQTKTNPDEPVAGYACVYCYCDSEIPGNGFVLRNNRYSLVLPLAESCRGK